ncbi:MAG: flagellar protein [Halobacteriovoraceae bacterium]|jgi:flagellar operon protein|nr:flagellar protein [Halobacteriovoraceae bacterium]
MATDGKINNFLIPNVSKLPKHKKIDKTDQIGGGKNEFQELLKGQLESEVVKAPSDGIKLSTHAAKRLQERNLAMDSNEYFKLKGAIDKLKSKGGQDSLVITDKAAYIVDVGNNTIVTAMDKQNMLENVFTKIDSTLIVN